MNVADRRFSRRRIRLDLPTATSLLLNLLRDLRKWLFPPVDLSESVSPTCCNRLHFSMDLLDEEAPVGFHNHSGALASPVSAESRLNSMPKKQESANSDPNREEEKESVPC